MKIDLKLLEISIDLLRKVHDVIKENKLNALEQLHTTTREHCCTFKVRKCH